MADTSTQPLEDKSLPRNVSMYAEQWAVVEEVNEQFGFRNLSVALRHIINDYRRMKAQQAQQAQADPA
jgi:hypothetical protein